MEKQKREKIIKIILEIILIVLILIILNTIYKFFIIQKYGMQIIFLVQITYLLKKAEHKEKMER